MIRNLRCLFFFAIAAISLICTLHAHGATVQAASCQHSDVNAVINGPTHVAANGDTIQIPAGTCTWTSGINIPSGIGITIVGSGTPNSTPGTTGAGTSNTIIVDDISTSSSPRQVFVAAPTYGNATMRISTLEIEPQSGASPYSPLAFWSTCTSIGCPNIRVDNITFPSSWYSDASLQDGAVLLANNSWGVIDHNTITGVDGAGYLGFANFSDGNWLGIGQYGDNSWTQPDTFGTQEAIYLENNLFSTNVVPVDCDTSDAYADAGGCRYVARFNTDNGVSGTGAFSNHGTESSGRPRGGRQAEIYNNTFICTNTQQGCNSVAGFRSGVAYVFDNNVTVNAGSWINKFLALAAFRTFSGFVSWNYCAGQGPYDQNDGVTYYLGTITSVSTTGGTLVVTVAGTPWTASQWVNNGEPYSVVDTSITTLDSGSNIGSPGYEITANTTNALSASGYGADYWNPNKKGPPTISVGDTIKILRAQYCIDQPSRSGGTLLSGATPSPTGWVNEVLDPSYEWGDTSNSAPGYGAVESDTAKLIANRDFYEQVSSFTGASGVGVGTLSARPSTCTTGVAYWDTSEGGTWNNGQANSGALDICRATNNWTSAYYTPYPYPHPLISGTQPVGPDPPSGVTGTLQ